MQTQFKNIFIPGRIYVGDLGSYISLSSANAMSFIVNGEETMRLSSRGVIASGFTVDDHISTAITFSSKEYWELDAGTGTVNELTDPNVGSTWPIIVDMSEIASFKSLFSDDIVLYGGLLVGNNLYTFTLEDDSLSDIPVADWRLWMPRYQTTDNLVIWCQNIDTSASTNPASDPLRGIGVMHLKKKVSNTNHNRFLRMTLADGLVDDNADNYVGDISYHKTLLGLFQPIDADNGWTRTTFTNDFPTSITESYEEFRDLRPEELSEDSYAWNSDFSLLGYSYQQLSELSAAAYEPTYSTLYQTVSYTNMIPVLMSTVNRMQKILDTLIYELSSAGTISGDLWDLSSISANRTWTASDGSTISTS